jgi:PAS domain S-box-containing protein
MRIPDSPSQPSATADFSSRARAFLRRISNTGIIVAFVLIVALLIGNAIITYNNTVKLQQESQVVQHSHEVIEAIYTMHSAIKDAEAAQRGYLLTADPQYLQPYREGLARARARLSLLSALVADDTDQSARMPRLQQSVDLRLRELDDSLALFDESGFTAARERAKTGFGRNEMDEVRVVMDEMTTSELGVLAERSAIVDRTFRIAILSALITTVTSIVLFAAAFILIKRNIAARSRATLALAKQGDLLQTTLASIVEGVIVTDAHGHVTFVNRMAQELTGHTINAGQPIASILDLRDEVTRAPVMVAPLVAIRTGAVVATGRKRVLVHADGSERMVEESAAPLRDHSGTIVGSVLALRDVTHQRAVEQEVAGARAYAESIVETVPDPLVILDAELRVRSANLAFFQMFETTEEETVGRPFFEASAGAWDERAIRELVDSVDTSGGPVQSAEVAHVFPAQGKRLLRLNARRMLGTGAHAAWTLVAIRDVTEARANERSIKRLLKAERDNAERLRQVAAASLMINSAHSREGVLARLRDEARRILGLDEAVVTLDSAETGRGSALLSAPLTGGNGELLGHIRMRGASTREREVSESDRAILEQLAHVASVAIENAGLYEELRDGDRRKDEFLATLAHELRNPLAPVRNSIQILRSDHASTTDRVQAMATIDRQVALLVRLVDDLLDVSRITRGKVVLKKERSILGDIIGQALEVSRPAIHASGHTLIIHVPKEEIVVDVDPSRIAQVLSNLLNNAAKYTEQGGHIKLSCFAESGEVVLKVSDDGIGIPAEMLPHVFDMFWQLEHALERAEGGLGIGLTLVRQLVELHGGRVEAHSEGEGRGSEFTVRLALAPTLATLPPRERGPDAATASASDKLRILVVDDNVDSAESLALLLRLQGHDVSTAYDGVQALELEEELRPQLVLLDIGLPRMNGYEAASCLRTRRADQLTIVAMTGWGEPDVRRRSHEAGFHHHLVKPVDPVLLRRILGELQTRKR